MHDMCVESGVRSENNLSNQIDLLTDYKDVENNESNTLDYVKLAIVSHDAPADKHHP